MSGSSGELDSLGRGARRAGLPNRDTPCNAANFYSLESE